MLEKEINISEIKTYLDNNQEIEIETPDGWVKVLRYIPQGLKKIYNITLENNLIFRCTKDHKIDVGTLEVTNMVKLEDLSVGDLVYTKTGHSRIINISEGEVQEVCDIEVEHNNHRFWIEQGVSVSNCNRHGYESMLKHSGHLYDLTAIGDYNAIERDSTRVLAVAQTPEMQKNGEIQIQSLASRESENFPPFKMTVDGSTGWFHESGAEFNDDDIIDVIEELHL